MNQDLIVKTIENCLDRSGKLYEEVATRVTGLPPDTAEVMRNHYLSKPIEEVLGQQEEFADGVGFMVNQVNGYGGFHRRQVSAILVARARQSGSAKSAGAWLEKVLGTSSAKGFCIMALWGVPCDSPVALSQNI